MSDIEMKDAFGSDEVNYLLPDEQVGLARKRECLDLLDTSEDDYCLTRRSAGSFDASKYTTGVALWDRDGQTDVEHVSDYATDIFQRLFAVEVSPSCHPLIFLREFKA
jgi:hypothetical protein